MSGWWGAAAIVSIASGLAGASCSSHGGGPGGARGAAGNGEGGEEPPSGGVGGAGGAGAAGAAGAAGDGVSTEPDIVIVLDRSASMNDGIDETSCTGGCGANSKWALLTAELGPAVSSKDNAVRWGLKLFASNDSCAVADGVDVAPQLSKAARIAGKLGTVSAASSTPTTAAVTAAAAYLAQLTDGARKYILLITDGAPNRGSAGCAPGSGYMTNQCDDANAIAAVKQTYGERGIPTFVVGVGMTTGPAEETLTQLALQGGTALPAFPSTIPSNAQVICRPSWLPSWRAQPPES